MGSVTPTRTRGHQEGPFDIRKIAIVGAGPCGLAAARYLLAEAGAFEQIVIFEQAAEVGGVWNYSTEASPAAGWPHMSQADAAHGPPEEPISSRRQVHEQQTGVGGEKDTSNGVGDNRDESNPGIPLFPTPMYDDLHTNIPHTLMRYSDLEFPPQCEIFPSRQAVQEYLVRYSQEVRQLIRFSTQVTDVSRIPPQKQGSGAEAEAEATREKWRVRSRNILCRARASEGDLGMTAADGEETAESYDAVVVASGHYSTPFVPNSIRDISRFAEAYPRALSHSKAYRNPEPYRDKKVVIVGSGASGLDIASQIKEVCKPPLLVSAKTPVPAETIEHIRGIEVVGEIERFLAEERGVVFRSDDDDKEPRTELDIDAVLFCTGYLYTFPFLRSLDPPIVTDGRRVHGVARHLLHIYHPTLAFPGLPMKIIPFPLAESQAAVFSGLWSNALALPPRKTLEEWTRNDEAVAKKQQPVKGFHVFPKGGDGQYINSFHEWAMLKKERSGDDGAIAAKEPPFWGPEELWQRNIYAEAKIRFEKMGKKAKTLAELGFRYEPEKVEIQTPEQLKKTETSHLDVAG